MAGMRKGRVEGKVAFVTGGAKGMGRETALLLAEEGATLIVNDVDDEGGQQTVDDINKQGGQALYLGFDVAKLDAWKSAVGRAMDAFGRVDILVNNAGILLFKPVHETTEDELDRMLAVNVKGVFFGTQAILPAMQAAGGGSIVNFSSIYGLVGAPGAAAYETSKGAVRLLTKATASDYGQFNIRVNSVHPGVIRTPMTKDILKDEASTQDILRGAIMRRPAEPKELAWAVLFLASDESSYMTGSELVVDGGYSAV
jgi:cyclopentanol dehydrogenase